MSNLSLRSKILLGFLIPIGLIAIASVVTYQVLESSLSTSKRVAFSNRVIAMANALSKTIVDAETGARGFVITGEERFLEPYIEALTNVERTAARLRELVADKPVQLERIENAVTAFNHWKDEVAEPIIMARRSVPVGFLMESERVYSTLLETQLAEVRYLASPDVDALSEWGKTLGELRARMTVLLRLEDNPKYRAAWEQILARIDAYESEFQAAVKNADSRSLPLGVLTELRDRIRLLFRERRQMEQTIVRLIAAGKGKVLIDQFRQVMEEFVHREDELLNERIAASEGAVRQAKVMAWAGPGFGLGLALLVGVVLSFRIGQSLRSVAEAARGLAAGDLNRRARVQSKDEIGVMARTFNAMADRLAAMVEAEHRDKQALSGRVNELVERRTREVVLLNEMGEMLQAAIHMEEAYTVISKLAGQLFPDVDGALFIINPSRNVLEAVATWGASPPDGDKSVFTPTECWALRRGRAHIVENTASDLLCQHLPEPPPQAYLCVPLVAQGDAMGVFYLRGLPDSEDSPVVWTDAKRQLAITVAEHLALALANLRLRDTLRSQSIRDSLTGLFNRRYMEETLERELLRARRNHTSLSVLMIDIDHFKQFNDKFGHEAGDFVLQEVGKVLQTGFRGEDIPCRHGGEEFALLLPGTSLEDARQRAEQLRVVVEKLEIYYRERPLGKITLSIGIAVFPVHGSDPKTLLRLADEALYQAKAQGRNRVVVA